MIALTILLSLLAWGMLSLAMPKHGQALFKGRLGEAGMRRLRWAGFALLLAGFAVVVAGAGWEFGAVYWLGILMLTAILWVLVLTMFNAGKPARQREPRNPL